jgi:sugar lactone lactonase YvrE
MGDLEVDVALHLRAEHAEGPAWDAATARLWWVDITRQRVHCFDPLSGSDCSWPSPGQPGGVVLDDAGDAVVATTVGLAVLDRESGLVLQCVDIESDRPGNRANDAKVDGAGRVWVGTMSMDKRRGAGSLYRVEGDRATRVVEDLTISNGPAFDEREGRLYLADTADGRVDLFDLDPDRGEISGRRPFLDVSDVGHWPDGMTVDDEGRLWVALGRSGAVHRYDPSGRLDAVLELPTSNPTSVTFGGPDGGDLYITTSWFDLEPATREAEPMAGAIYRCRPGVTGPPSPRYHRTAPPPP